MGLLLFAGGAVVYAWAWFGLRDIESWQAPPGAPQFSTMAQADRLSTLSGRGLLLMGAGIALFVLAALLVRVLRRRATATPE